MGVESASWLRERRKEICRGSTAYTPKVVSNNPNGKSWLVPIQRSYGH